MDRGWGCGGFGRKSVEETVLEYCRAQRTDQKGGGGGGRGRIKSSVTGP